jgi:hypothetical protein
LTLSTHTRAPPSSAAGRCGPRRLCLGAEPLAHPATIALGFKNGGWASLGIA